MRDDGRGLAPAAFCLADLRGSLQFSPVKSVMLRQAAAGPSGNRDWGPATRDLRREYRMRFSNIHLDTRRHKDCYNGPCTRLRGQPVWRAVHLGEGK